MQPLKDESPTMQSVDGGRNVVASSNLMFLNHQAGNQRKLSLGLATFLKPPACVSRRAALLNAQRTEPRLARQAPYAPQAAYESIPQVIGT